MTLAVVIADDQPLVRAGVRAILETDPAIAVAGEAGDGAEAIELARRARPDVIVMDVRMPVLDGVEATRRITSAGDGAPRVLILTTFDEDAHVYGALRAGAGGFLLKDAPAESLIAAVHTVARGEALLAPAATRRLIARFAAEPAGATRARADALDDLTPRELEVLRLVARGLSNAQIASELVVGEATVKTHVARLFWKLGVRDRAGAVVVAYETGAVVPGQA